MSVLSPTLKSPLDALAVVVAVVVVDALSLLEPQPAATVASARTSTRYGVSRFNGASEVLDSGTKTVADSTSHAVVGVVLRARDGRLEVLLAGDDLPAARLSAGSSLEAALARAVDVSALARVEQLETVVLAGGGVATAYLGLVAPDAAVEGEWRAASRVQLPLVAAAQARLRAKLSYTNVGFALAPSTFTISGLREIYGAALGHDVSATNLQHVLVRRGVLERVDGRRAPGRTGGRPAALFRFRSARLEVTDEFAALRPPR